eukprot:COSAG06_NODE_5898_length_3223_cov_23.806658_2_plen_202_part_00
MPWAACRAACWRACWDACWASGRVRGGCPPRQCGSGAQVQSWNVSRRDRPTSTTRRKQRNATPRARSSISWMEQHLSHACGHGVVSHLQFCGNGTAASVVRASAPHSGTLTEPHTAPHTASFSATQHELPPRRTSFKKCGEESSRTCNLACVTQCHAVPSLQTPTGTAWHCVTYARLQVRTATLELFSAFLEARPARGNSC